MSIRIMSAVWDINLAASEKIVLLALADAADDDGRCWPSIATIGRKASKSPRTVQSCIQALIEAGHLSRREVVGRGCYYTVHPRKTRTPANSAPRKTRTPPPQNSHPTPANSAGDPRKSRTQTIKNHKEPSLNRITSPKRQKADETLVFPCPHWCEKSLWNDFMANRKAKKLTSTDTAYRNVIANLETLHGIHPDKTLTEIFTAIVARGWGGIYDPFRPSSPQHEKDKSPWIMEH